MIGRMIFCLVLVCGAGAASAQEPACRLYTVNTSMLNISKDPGGQIYNDALFDGDQACVARLKIIAGTDWAFIAYKLGKGNAHTPVEGWAALQYLQQASGAAAPPPAGATAAAPPAATPPAAPPGAPVTPSGTAAKSRPEDVLRFNQPIPFGAFPVNGHSIEEMIDQTPFFSPVEGLDEPLWQKKCTSCHKWNQDRLCEQAKTYVKHPRFVLRVQHPFGGTLKLALMRWAISGCQ